MPDRDFTIPQHIAIIMDGNGRWASSRGLPHIAGHRAGIEAVRRTLQAATDSGIPYLTLYGFSSENWRRPQKEVEDLMGLLRFYLQGELAHLHKEQVRLSIIGDRTRFSPDIVRLIEEGEKLTSRNTRIHLTIALSYGSRQELLRAVKNLVHKAPEEITEEALQAELYTAGIPDPDLVIRTSGEKRLSNFLLWQSAYAELVFVDTLWPDFSANDLANALDEFNRRERRYGARVG
ncbi:MAG: di-trans,poly-cis-decaprenylcistransferase [Proteobacteria bacterium]|nr:di-trans,poly-cis-decaprenylcistransferase [Pseudomonadota bacterium]